MPFDIYITYHPNQFVLNNNSFKAIDVETGLEVKGEYSLKKVNEMLENYLENKDNINNLYLQNFDLKNVRNLLPGLGNLPLEEKNIKDYNLIYIKDEDEYWKFI